MGMFFSNIIQPRHCCTFFRFDNLRIRREKKKEGGRKEKTPSKMEGRSDKVAYLLFTATLNSGAPNPLTVSCISDPIKLSKCYQAVI